MRDSLPAFGFLAALVIVPFLITAGIIGSVLHFTNSGLLVGRGAVTTQAIDQDAEKKVVQCSYFTGTSVVRKVVDHGEYGYRGQDICPWRIDLSA